MKKRIGLILLVIAIIVIANGFFIVNETQQCIITQFGNPIGEPIKDAGLHMKIPFIQKVHYFEKRIIEWDGDPKQIPTSDKRYLWVDTFARWRIHDPLRFYETTRSETFAHGRLDDIISGTTRDIISSYPLIEIVRNSNRELKYTEEYYASLEEVIAIEIEMGRNQLADTIHEKSIKPLEEYGIELVDVEIKRVNYIQEVRQKVYDRMMSERKKIAAKYRSAGKGKAAEISGKKQKELDLIQSEAYRQSQEIIGKADAEATKIYAEAYGKDADFYKFIKTLETYKETIKKDNVLIMTTDSEYYNVLKEGK